MTDYLLLAEVLAIHTDQIERYGGSQGVRDPGLLEAALFRPQTGYYADLIEEAAALGVPQKQKGVTLFGPGDALRGSAPGERAAEETIEGPRLGAQGARK